MATKTDETTEGQAPPADPKADPKNPTMGDVRKVIGEEIQAALAPIKDLLTGKTGDAGNPDPKSSQPPAGDGAPNLGAMVDAALAKAIGERDAKTKDDAHAASHAKLDAIAETKPMDRPRRSKWLGQIYDD